MISSIPDTDTPKVEPTSEDIAFSLYFTWLKHCIDLASQAHLTNYQILDKIEIDNLSEEEKRDLAFKAYLNSIKLLQEFVTSNIQDKKKTRRVFLKLKKYIRLTPDNFEGKYPV